jgi:predicted O-methyltransferase YrrM
MGQELWTAVSDYLDQLFVPHDPVLENILAASEAAGLPSISGTPLEGKLLTLLARIRDTRRILEIGTLGGYSTVWLARGLAQGGSMITLEANPTHANVARVNIASAGLAATVELREGLAGESLAQLVQEGAGPFDLIFIDADKEGYPEYFGWALKLSARGTLIVADNVVRDGEVAYPSSTDSRVHGTRRFNELLATEPRMQATVIQTFGKKGYDRLALALVIDDP